MSVVRNDFKLFAPIEKIDKEKRTVSGWATTESIDKQAEVVSYEASKEAFGEWPGNIREMHEPRAVGKAVEIIPDDDARKVWVTAKVSKGSEDTWQKILDGTLTGFSIGGQTLNKTTKIIKAGNGQSKQITEILKYRLNELSLVDNPANPDCAFELIKRADNGKLYQTPVVEDIKKVFIVEAEDPLFKEVSMHRAKADALAKKVLDKDNLEGLPESAWGVIRKFTKDDGVEVEERFVPLPDKVHAVNALDNLDSMGLNDIEKAEVHKKASAILGSAHDTEKCNFCINGGDSDMSGEAIKLLKELASTVNSLTEKVVGLEKAAVKDDPKSDPALGESSPEKPGAADDAQTQDPKGAYPAKGPVKANGTEDVAKAKDPATSDLKTQPEDGAYPAKGPVKAADSEDKKDEEKKDEEVAKAKDPATSDLKTQESPAAPVKKAEEVKKADDGKSETDKDGKSDDGKPEAEKDETQKSDSPKTEEVVRKLAKSVEDLKKRLDTIDNRPLPRKTATKVEKTVGASDESELTKEYNEVMKAVASGKPLSKDMESRREALLNKMLDVKFGGSVQKIQ